MMIYFFKTFKFTEQELKGVEYPVPSGSKEEKLFFD